MKLLNLFKQKKEDDQFVSFGHGLAFKRAFSMPSKMPKGIEFHFNKNMGMRMGGSTIRISENYSHYSTHFSAFGSGYSFSTTQEELESLYKTFRENNFHKIEHDDKTTHDISGDSLSIQWQDQCINVGRGMQGQIKKEYLEAYHNCIGAMEVLAEKDYGKHLRKVSIQMDETIRKEFKFSLCIEDFIRRKLFENNGSEKQVISLLTGMHKLELEIETPYFQKLEVFIPVLENHTSVLNLFLNKGKLNWESIISQPS